LDAATLKNRFQLFLTLFFSLTKPLKKLNHILGVDIENVFNKLRLQDLAMLINILIEVQSQLVDNWHTRFENFEEILSILNNALSPLNVFYLLNHI
jgi:hypothetical protein